MTPYEINVALHYHSHVDDFSHQGAPIWDETAKWFLDNGLLVMRFHEDPAYPRIYDPTPKLHAYVEMLCETPLPVQKWIRPNEPTRLPAH